MTDELTLITGIKISQNGKVPLNCLLCLWYF